MAHFGMRMNGRFETRVFLRLAILMRSPSHRSASDLALTENVSPRGARIITKRFRKPGELCEIADLSSGFYVSARIVYCERLANRNYCIGLELEAPQQDWWQGSRDVRTAPVEKSSRAELNLAP
jgi:hypothetical protein